MELDSAGAKQDPPRASNGRVLPGHSLNPFGRPRRGDTFKDCLNRIIDVPGVDARTKRERICEMASELAEKGVPWATQWIKDTTEGKAAVHIEVDHKDAALKGLSDSEILDLIETVKARRLALPSDNSTND